MAGAKVEPPRAKKVEHKFSEMFGVVREDPYYWMRDDKREDPEVLAYLKQENEYTEAMMAPTKDFQESLFQEMRARIKEDDSTVPLRRGPYWYYNRQEEGKQYAVHCRRAIPGGEGAGTLEEALPSGPDGPVEEVILDENEKAAAHDFYRVGPYEVSPDHKLLAFGPDIEGGERFTLRVMEIASGKELGTPVPRVDYSVAWASDNETLFYCTKDHVERADKVWRHRLGTDPSEDVCVFHEPDESYSVSVGRSSSGAFLFLVTGSSITSDARFVSAEEPLAEWAEVLPREHGVDVSVAHSGDHFFITRRSEELFNSELLVCQSTSPGSTNVLLPHRADVKIEYVQTFERHLAVFERSGGLQSITVYDLPPDGQPITALEKGRRISFPEEAYSLSPERSQFKSHILRFGFESLKTPASVFDYDMDTGERALKKVDPVLGGFNADDYDTVRRWATAADGVQVPISIVYRKDVAKLDGTDPLHLYGYGSYEISIDPYFKSDRLSLLDRGVTFAIAHIRGGGEMGRQWYEDGKYLQKKNTFTDFITCAEYLVENKWAAPGRLSIEGRSAGGLLIGAVVNLRPDLFTAAFAGVPFVDVVTTMLDPSIPLTTAEWEEWGNPSEKDYFEYMLSYSPVDNVARREYPHILVTAGLNDPRVAYWEPSKWVAKLRENKADSKLLLYKCDMGAGHFSKSGRFDKLRETAFEYSFLLGCHGLVPQWVFWDP